MLSPRLLNRLPNQAIEDKYQDHILFRFLSFVCKPLMTEAKEYAIYPGELFYNCVYSLDTLKSLSSKAAKEQSDTLIDDIYRYFNEKGLDKSIPEVEQAICLVTYSVECCLALTKPPTYTLPMGHIDLRIYSVNPEFLTKLKMRFFKAIKVIGEKPLQDFLNTYMHSRQLLSDEIAIVIDLSNNTEAKTDEKPTQEQLKSIFTIAYLSTNESGMLVNFLRSERTKATPNDWARYALAIYRHKEIFIKRPGGFSKWLPVFCEMFGRNVPYHAPSDLDRVPCANSIELFFPQ